MSTWKKVSFITGKLSLKRIHSEEPSDTGTETEEPTAKVQNLWLLYSEHNYPWESLKGKKLNPRCTPGNKHWKHRIALMSINYLATEASSFKQDSKMCVTVFHKTFSCNWATQLNIPAIFSVKPERPGELIIPHQRCTAQEPSYASHRLQNWLYKLTPFQSVSSTWCPGTIFPNINFLWT